MAASLFGGLFASACGGNGNSQPFGSVSAAQACADRAQTLCAKRASCSGDDNIYRVYGTMEACLGRVQLTCMDGLAAKNQGNAPALVEMCANSTPTLDCAAVLDDTPSGPCAPAGPLPNGSACSFQGRCASGSRRRLFGGGGDV